MDLNLKDMVKDNKKVKFLHYQHGELWYETETGFKFPVPIDDTGDGKFPAEDKALLYMRYIKRQIKVIEEAVKETGYTSPYHVTGTDNPIDFPKYRICAMANCGRTAASESEWCDDHIPLEDGRQCRCDRDGGALGGCPVHDSQ